jgi:hypothetical protein
MQRFLLVDKSIHGLFLVGLLGVLILPCLAFAQDAGHAFHGASSEPKIDYEALYDAAVPLSDSESGRHVLAECLEAYGGVEKLKSLKGFRIHYNMKPMMSENTKTIIKTVEQGRRYLWDGGEELRILNGQKCWYTKGDQVADMDGGRYRAELFSYLTLAMPLAAETENFDDIRFGRQDDDPLSYLYFDKADSVLVVLGIDSETRLISKSIGVIRQDEQRFVFVNDFGDFRQVDGFWFPHSLVNISMGLRIGESVVEKIDVNPDFDNGTFLPPGRSE